ncbi:oxidoreductase, FAD-binding, putative [Paecilomyces variotii No. 5]|uniref:Oxidoreductase, FAD-binding, putative n=1 Tax=Byssochlamys spectabilis (strain No. 5 / NBRC 109023) TaxID=1356009 RepID=V5FML7_BYSSN|nr:oxidoreductase, FAD-binding, putative [Paecilomyces variotii No. 5]
MATSALQGWHPGELVMQRKFGFEDAVRDTWAHIRNFMPEQHRIFHTSNLPFIPITTFDEEGRPWSSIVAGSTGEIGFVKSPDERTLSLNIRIWDGDPLLDTVKAWIDPKRRAVATPERFLTAGLGIEFSTRRRNKFAGFIEHVCSTADSEYNIDLRVTETVGNCPKYINVRKLIPHPHTQPVIAYNCQHLGPYDRLPDEVIEFILEADTVFVGSIYKSDPSTAEKFPSHSGMNARGGLPGFIRVRPSDGRTVVLPDYSGNRFLASLGNIEAGGLASFTIVSFATGDILYLTGTAENLVGPPALEVMTRHAGITLLRTTGFIIVRDALPIRQQTGTSVERSPYSPKIKYLVEETASQSDTSGQYKAHLESATQLSEDLAVFRFRVAVKAGAENINIRPGQAIVLDFMDWMGPPQYHHMADSNPQMMNDDRLRTWTVSSSHEGQEVSWFELTMRKMKGGAVTGALFDILRRPSTKQGSLSLSDNAVHANIVGVTGDFFMPNDKLNVAWIAGGIGITPFLAMLNALANRGPKAQGDILFILSTREPGIMLELMRGPLENMSPAVKISVDIFSSNARTNVEGTSRNKPLISFHKGRVASEYWMNVPKDKDVFICGPNSFGDAVAQGLQAGGVLPTQIHREGFY